EEAERGARAHAAAPRQPEDGGRRKNPRREHVSCVRLPHRTHARRSPRAHGATPLGPQDDLGIWRFHEGEYDSPVLRARQRRTGGRGRREQLQARQVHRRSGHSDSRRGVDARSPTRLPPGAPVQLRERVHAARSGACFAGHQVHRAVARSEGRPDLMRVLHVCPTHFSPGSVLAGAERYSYGLCKAMSRVTPTTLVTFGDAPFETHDGELTIRCYRRWAYVKGQRTNPFAPDFVKDILGADVVHCHQFKVVASDIAILGAALSHKRVFVTDLGGNSGFSLSYHLPLWRLVRAFLLISEFNQSLFADLAVPK